MKYLFHEIKKVFDQRFFVLITTALLVICTGLSAFSIRKSASALRNEEAVESYRLYNENPNSAQALFEEYAAKSKVGIDVPDTYSYLRGIIRRAENNTPKNSSKFPNPLAAKHSNSSATATERGIISTITRKTARISIA